MSSVGSEIVLIAVHHVQLTVPRGASDRARAFYGEALGLAEIPKPAALAANGGFWLSLGGLQIHVGEEDGIDRAATKAHLCYEVTDLELWKNRVRSLGLFPEDGTPIPGAERFEFRDPFGNRVEMIRFETVP